MIRQKINVNFYVVGSKVTDEIKALEQPGSGIIVKGFVTEEELASLYSTSRIVVVPLRYGAGVKGKVVEAVYNGSAIVTTSIGSEGIPEAERVMKVADGPQALALDVLKMYEDPTECRRMCEETQKYILENFRVESAWKVIEEDFTPEKKR